MKPFDLEKAKNGAAVCLKDETPVKVLDFDFDSHILCKVKTPESGKEEIIFCINNFGECIWSIDVKLGKSENLKVFMAPVYAYINVFKSEDGTRLHGGTLYPTPEDCVKRAKRTWNARPFCIARVELLEDPNVYAKVNQQYIKKI